MADKAKTEKREGEKPPVNNLYWIPVALYSFLPCLGDEVAKGIEISSVLVEGKDEIYAVARLMGYLGYYENYAKLNPEERRKIRQPFNLSSIGRIEKVLFCDKRFKSRSGDYTCGRPVHDIEGHEDQHSRNVNMNGKFGMCCVEGYDVPEGLDCPYKDSGIHVKPRF